MGVTVRQMLDLKRYQNHNGRGDLTWGEFLFAPIPASEVNIVGRFLNDAVLFRTAKSFGMSNMQGEPILN